MNGKLAIIAAASFLLSACAHDGPTRPPRLPDDSAPVAGAASSGASSAAAQQAGATPRARTRAEVHAEAVQAVKNHKSTLDDELEWFNPFTPR